MLKVPSVARSFMGEPNLRMIDSDRMIAVVGLGAVLPKAKNVEEFWKNVLAGRDCISPVPKERWDPAVFFRLRTHSRDSSVMKSSYWLPSRDFRLTAMSSRE